MTRQLVICLLLVVSTVCTIQAQHFSYGLRAGMDVNTSETPSKLDATQFGFYVGFGGKLYVQPEIYYCMRAGSMSATNSYVRIPLLVGYQLFESPVIGMHLLAGPTYNKQLVSGSVGAFTWGLGGGLDFFRIVSADLRYTFKKDNSSALINTSRINFTVGVRL